MPPATPATRPRGFTLIEIIVIIVLAGFLGALVASLMGTQLLKSSTPVIVAKDAAGAETAMENVVAFYTGRVNANLTTALDEVQAQYAGNSTVSITDTANWQTSNVRVLTVTVTVGQTRLTTLLTQTRSNAADNATSF